MSNVEITIDFKDAEGNPSSPEYFNSLPDWKSKLDNFIELNDAEVVTTSDKMTLIIPYDNVGQQEAMKRKVLADLGFATGPAWADSAQVNQWVPIKSSGVNWAGGDYGLEVGKLWRIAKSHQDSTPRNRSASVVGDWLINAGFPIRKQANAVDYHRAKILDGGGWVWISTEEYEPLEADIAVFEGANGGHIQVFDGSQWVSDYRQPDFYPTGYSANSGNYYLYRNWDVVGETVPEGVLFDMGSDSRSPKVVREDTRDNVRDTMLTMYDGLGYFSKKAWDYGRIRHFAFREPPKKDLVNATGGPCKPGQKCLHKDAHAAFKAILEHATKPGQLGGSLKFRSGYRSVAYQAQLAAKYGFDSAAPAGYSEHSTGLAIDFASTLGHAPTPNNPNIFNGSSTYRWLRENAYKFGFVQSFKPPSSNPSSARTIHNVNVEGWHWMFVGTDKTMTGDRKWDFPASMKVQDLRRPTGADSRSGR